ncbi:MAG: hypothetical protein KDD25_08010 [Bdellovibrionales bacterium]|nr:hypothetical protein [Bdellovibrionales bacterium]
MRLFNYLALFLFFAFPPVFAHEVYLPDSFSPKDAVGSVVSRDDKGDEVQSKLDIAFGLQSAVFSTPLGDIFVFFPADLRAGDVVSGRVLWKANAKSDKDKKLKEFKESYQVAVGNYLIPSDLEAFRLNLGCNSVDGDPIPDVDVILEQFLLRQQPVKLDQVPDKSPVRKKTAFYNGDASYKVCAMKSDGRPPEGKMGIFVLDKRGKKILSSVDVGVDHINPSSKPDDYYNPTTSSSGRPSYVTGGFDGDMVTGEVTVDQEQGSVIVEGPRYLVYMMAKNNDKKVGKSRVSLTKEDGQTVSGETYFYDVEINYSNEHPKVGETIEVEILVSGLAGFDAPMFLHVVNRTPNLGHMAKGDEQIVKFNPSELGAGEVYRFTDRITVTGIGNIQNAVGVRHETSKSVIRNMK